MKNISNSLAIFAVFFLLSIFQSGQAAPVLQGNSLVVLHPTRSKALTVENSGLVAIPDGTLRVFSKNRNAVGLYNGAEISVNVAALAGGVQMDRGAKANARQNLRLTETLDPLANLTETVSKDFPSHGAIELKTGETQLEPGVYDGIFLSGDAHVSLAPGLYIIEHELALSSQSKLSGEGVTLINQGEFYVDNSSTLELSAPNDGPTQGLVLWQPRANNRSVQMQASASATIRGAIYLPTGTLEMRASAKLQCTNLFAEAVSVSNSAQLLIK